MPGRIVIHERRFWRERSDGSLRPIRHPETRGLASRQFSSSGVNNRGRRTAPANGDHP